MIIEIKILLFLLGSLSIIWISRSSLRHPRSHGFYRFFAWQTLLVLFLVNMNFWFFDPFSLRQLLSWLFLVASLVWIFLGVRMFRRLGKLDRSRDDPALVGIEKTTALVTTGVYRYIRHPFYSSLLFLGWGILLKRVHWSSILLAGITTMLLWITARKEEVENIQFFGEEYQEYMAGTKMFIPFLL